MDEKVSTRRHIICIDDSVDASSIPGLKNPTSVTRLYTSVKKGSCFNAQGRNVEQAADYFQVDDPRATLAGKFGIEPAAPNENQIRDIVFKICERVKSASDEIFLFGSGHGAYVARAVAGILHHMGVPKPEHLKAFTAIYHATAALIKSRGVDGSRNLDTVSQSLRTGSCDPANIQFLGLLDALGGPTDAEAYDTRVLSTVRNFRHALAFNENRASKSPDVPKSPVPEELLDRSFIQAWFLGSHSDIVGGTQHDGLALYPLQWIMIEAMQAGLILSLDVTKQEPVAHDNPLALVFPQDGGQAPDLTNENPVIWQIQYRNGIEVKMFDVQCVHVEKSQTEEVSHFIHLEAPNFLSNTSRRIFDKSKRGLIGYEAARPYGTIIHPSVFCILHRNPRFLEQHRFKSYKMNLSNFEADCFQENVASMPPWLQNSELLVSGVKAFRILVCGKTGVGKSTLINKIFGVEMVRTVSYGCPVHIVLILLRPKSPTPTAKVSTI
jgi:hypothetical protein